MICTIYLTGELKKRRIKPRDGVLVLGRRGEELLLFRGKDEPLWCLPQGKLMKGESDEEAARRIFGESIGEAEYTVRPLCEYSVTDEGTGKESGGTAWLADVTDMAGNGEIEIGSFDRVPMGYEMKDGALVAGLRRFAGDFFETRLIL